MTIYCLWASSYILLQVPTWGWSGVMNLAADAQVEVFGDGGKLERGAGGGRYHAQPSLHHVGTFVDASVGEGHVFDDEDVFVGQLSEGELVEIDRVINGKAVVREKVDALKIGRLLDPDGRRLRITLEGNGGADRNGRVHLLDARQSRGEEAEKAGEEKKETAGGNGRRRTMGQNQVIFRHQKFTFP